MPRKNKKYKKTKHKLAQKMGLYVPELVQQKLRAEAVRQNCSLSWLVTECIMHYLNISVAELEQHNGLRPPKNRSERKDYHKQNKNK